MPLRTGPCFILGILEFLVVLALWNISNKPEYGTRSFSYSTLKYTTDNGNKSNYHYNNGSTEITNTKKMFDSNTFAAESNKSDMCLFQKTIHNYCKILSSKGNKNSVVYLKLYSIMNSVLMNQDCSLSTLMRNCTNLRSAHGYDDKPVTKEELDFPLAFGVRLHKSAEQVEQLLRTVYRPHNVYCIHVDRKADSNVYNTIKNISQCFKNIIVLEDRETIVYSSSGVIKADMKCMLACLKSGVKWKYYLNLSGQEFPLRTNLEIVSILKIFQGVNDVEAYDYPKHQEERFKKIYVPVENRLVKTNINKPPFGYDIQMSKGSAYGMFSRHFVEFVLFDDVAGKLLKWLEDTCSPEENIWATLNSLPWAPGGYYIETRHSLNTHASRALIWKWDQVKCFGRFVRSVCVFTFRDLPWLVSQPHVIANKFDIDLDRVALDCLESLLLNRIHHPLLQTFDRSYFRNLPQVKFYRDINETMKSSWFLKQTKKEWLDAHPWKQL